MSGIFSGTVAFDQNLGSWDISSVTAMTDTLSNSGLSLANYDATLIGWDAQALQPNVPLGATGLSYCLGESARANMISSDGWTITGDTLDCAVSAPAITSSDTFTVAENTTVVASVTATGTAPITYSIVGGADAALFTIDENTGALSFLSAPDYENPGDSGGNNVYDVTARASNSAGSDDQPMTVTVTDVSEIGAPDTDGDGVTDDVDLDDDNDGILDSVEGVGARFVEYDYNTGNVDAGPGPANLVLSGGPFDGQTLGANLDHLIGAFEPNAVNLMDPTTGSITEYDFVTGGVKAGPSAVTAFVDGPWAGDTYLSHKDDIVDVFGLFGLTVYEAGNGRIFEYSWDTGLQRQPYGAIMLSGGPFAGQTVAGVMDKVVGAGPSFNLIIFDATSGRLHEYNSSTGAYTNFQSTVTFTNGPLAGAAIADHVDNMVGGDWLTRVMILLETDTDSDGTPDRLDLDSDGDGIPDNVEAQSTAGYIAPNGTVDANGVDTAYNGGLTPVNTDGTDEPDYLDTDSDNEGGDDAVESGNVSAGEAYADVNGSLDNGAADLPDGDGDGEADFRDAVVNGTAPTITSGASVSIPENTTVVTTVTASGTAPITYSIVGGADAALFTIDENTGVLSFITAPDYEAPADSGGDNVYDVMVQASNSAGTNGQTIAVTVTNDPADDNAGIEYKLVYNSTTGLYEIWMRATTTPTLPGTTGTAQVTVKALHIMGSGIFSPTNITAQIADTDWAIGSRTDAPTADTSADYISFALDFPTFNNGAINWQGGQEILMVTFANGGVCAGSVTLMENSDPFNTPPNNPGQQIDVFGLGSDPANDFLGNYGLGQGDCDTDGDGVSNDLDADDDGDGIPDSIEGDLTIDTDNDGIPDVIDADSDGDGIPDNIEAQSTAGYVTPSGADDDGDGIDNAYDADCIGACAPGAGGTGATGTPLDVPVNSDGDSGPAVPDYLDTDSDNEGGNDTAEAGLTLSGVDTDKDGIDDGVDSNTGAFGPVNAGVVDPAATYPDGDSDAGSGGDVDYRDSTDDSATGVTVPLKVILGGAYESDTGLMGEHLRTLPDFPLTSPYGGSETIGSSAILTANNIVDWVLVELRDNAAPATVVATRAALLQADGDLVDVDGTSTLTVNGVTDGNYYVAVRHRNHLGVMTAAPVPLSATTALIDFTLPGTAVYGVHARQVNNVTGAAVLWPGDANQDGQVIAAGPSNDRNRLLETVFSAPANQNYAVNYIVDGYRVTDLNLDGVTLASGPDNDDNIILSTVFLHPNNGSFATNYIVEEQIP